MGRKSSETDSEPGAKNGTQPWRRHQDSRKSKDRWVFFFLVRQRTYVNDSNDRFTQPLPPVMAMLREIRSMVLRRRSRNWVVLKNKCVFIITIQYEKVVGIDYQRMTINFVPSFALVWRRRMAEVFSELLEYCVAYIFSWSFSFFCLWHGIGFLLQYVCCWVCTIRWFAFYDSYYQKNFWQPWRSLYRNDVQIGMSKSREDYEDGWNTLRVVGNSTCPICESWPEMGMLLLATGRPNYGHSFACTLSRAIR